MVQQPLVLREPGLRYARGSGACPTRPTSETGRVEGNTAPRLQQLKATKELLLLPLQQTKQDKLRIADQ
jgi:hypothetical protein